MFVSKKIVFQSALEDVFCKKHFVFLDKIVTIGKTKSYKVQE